jgi:hypothetical protein
MLLKIVSTKDFWKLAALVALVAVPLIFVARKTSNEKNAVPIAGDDSDLFERELSAD